MEQPHLHIRLDAHPAFRTGYEKFYESYDLCKIIFSWDPVYQKSNLKSKHQRVCIFCGAAGDSKKFKSDAHLVPELIGNKELFSDLECDNCNHMLGKLESDLAIHMGIVRTIGGVKTKKCVPSFKSKGNTLTARSSFMMKEDTVVISRGSPDDDTITSDNKAGTIT